MGIHSLFVRIPSRSSFRIFLILLCILALCLSGLPNAEAQRRGWGGGWGGGYRPSTPSYKPPVYRPAPTPRTLPQRQVTPKPTTPARPGSSPTVRTAPTVKPNTPVTGVLGYKGQVTAKGLPVVQYKGKNWQIPQQGVSKSLKSNLLASTSSIALNSRWNTQQRQVVKKRVSALAAGTAVAAVSNGSGGDRNQTDAKNAKGSFELRKKLALESQMAENGTVIAGEGSKVIFRDAGLFAKKHGGNPSDWVKKSSTAANLGNGYQIETHWVENIKTGKRVDFKTKEVPINTKPNQ